MHIMNRRAPWKFGSDVENPILQALQFQALWKASLTLMLNRSLLNREFNLINVLKALVTTVSMCSLLEIFLSKIHQDILRYLQK
jgi:hypothetical protein